MEVEAQRIEESGQDQAQITDLEGVVTTLTAELSHQGLVEGESADEMQRLRERLEAAEERALRQSSLHYFSLVFSTSGFCCRR